MKYKEVYGFLTEMNAQDLITKTIPPILLVEKCFLTITEGIENLYDYGRKVLLEGAQEITMSLVEE